MGTLRELENLAAFESLQSHLPGRCLNIFISLKSDDSQCYPLFSLSFQVTLPFWFRFLFFSEKRKPLYLMKDLGGTSVLYLLCCILFKLFFVREVLVQIPAS